MSERNASDVVQHTSDLMILSDSGSTCDFGEKTAFGQVQALQVRLESAARELDDARKQAAESRESAKRVGEEAAELRGRLALATPEKHSGRSASARKV